MIGGNGVDAGDFIIFDESHPLPRKSKSMINCKEWESLDGTRRFISTLDTQHIVNAIGCIERNDPRYDVKHGAALPALLKEVERRAGLSAWGGMRKDEEAYRFVESRKPAMPDTTHRSMKMIRFVKVEPKTVEERLKEVERKTAGSRTLALADHRAGRAHRRLDALDESLRRGIARRDAQENKQNAKLADALERIADLEARCTAIETPTAKAKRATKAKRK